MKFQYIAVASVASLMSLFTVTAQCGDSVSGALPLNNPVVAPFPKQTSSDIKSFAPVLKDTTIVYGEKSLLIQPNGRFKIFSGGKELATINNTVRLKAGGHVESASRSVFTLGEMKSNGKGLFELNGIFKLRPDGSVTGKFRQIAELLPDGRVKIDISFTVPPGYEEETDEISLFLVFNKDSVQDKEFTVTAADGKTETFTFPNEEKYAFFMVARPKKLDLFGREAALCMEIEPVSVGSVLGWSKPQENILRFLARSNRVTLILDLRRGEAGISGEKHAGLDLRRLESMELPDMKSSRNLLLNPSFEQGASCGMFIQMPGFEASQKKYDAKQYAIDHTVAKFGKASLRINTWAKERTNGDSRAITNCGNILTFPVLLEPGDYTFSFYAKGNRAGQDIAVWFPSTWMHGSNRWLSHPTEQLFPVTSEWKRFETRVTVPHDLPVRVAFNAISPTGDGSVWIDGMQLERGTKLTPFTARAAEGELITSADNNFIRAGEPIRARLRITTSVPNASGTVKVTVRNFFGETLFSDTFPFKSNSDGIAEIPLPLEGKIQRGIFVVKAEYDMADGTKTYDFSRFGVMDFLENKHRLKNIFGVTYSLNMEESSNFPELLERCRQVGYGAKTWMHFNSEEIFKLYQKYGIEIGNGFTAQRTSNYGKAGFVLHSASSGHEKTPILLNDFQAESPNGELTDDYLKRFEDTVARIVSAHPWVVRWSLYGEDDAANPSFGGLSASDEEFAKYIKLQIANVNGIKKGNPKAETISPIPCNMSPTSGVQVLKRVLESTKGKIKYDWIGVHIYRESPEQPDLDADTDALIAMLNDYGYDKTPIMWPEGMQFGPYNIPSWGITSAQWTPPYTWEYGALSYDMGWTEKVASAWQARTWLVALKHSDRISFVNSTDIPVMFNMDICLTPYASQKIPNTLSRLLGDSYFRKDIRFAPYTRCFLFEDAQKRPVAAVWCHDPAVDAGTADAPMAAADFDGRLPEVFDLMETERKAVTDAEGRVQFPVSSFPLFFRGKAGETEQFIRAFENAVIVSGTTQSPVVISGRPTTPSKLQLEICNLVSRASSGEVTVGNQTIPVNLPSSGRAKVSIDMPATLLADRIQEESVPLSVKLSTEKRKIEMQASFPGFLCLKTAKPLAPGASDADWAAIPEIPLQNRLIARKGLEQISDRDFSGGFKIAWDEKNIYLRVRIVDDQFVHEEFPEDKKRCLNDALQFYFDPLLDARRRFKKGYDLKEYDYAIFPNAAGNSSFAFRYYSPDAQLTLGTAAPWNFTREAGIKTGFRRTSDGYIYEAVVPAMWVLPMRLRKGEATGFSLFAHDRDGDGRDVKSSLTLTPPGTASFNNPHLWPVMLLWE